MKKRKEKRWIILLVIAILLVIYPLLRPGFFVSDDGEWMIIRLSSFFQTLRDGQFPVRFLGRLNHGFGYPVANFLYPGYLYIGSLIHVLGFSFVDTVKIIVAGSVITSSVFIYKWLRTFFSVFASIVGSVFFLLSPYLVFDIYTRGSVGEILSLSAVSISLWSIESKRKTLFSLATALLLVSHNSLALLFAVFLICYLLMRHRQNFWTAYLLSIGMTMFFWFPALFEKTFIRFDEIVISDPSHYFDQSMSFIVRGFLGVGLILILFWNKLTHGPLSWFMIGVLAASVFFATSVSSFAWTGIVATLFQFPYRFLPLATIVSAWILAGITDKLGGKIQIVLLGLVGMHLLISVIPVLTHIQYVNRPISFYATNEATTTVANEYMPRWAKTIPTNRTRSPLLLYSGQGTVDIKFYNTQKLAAMITTTEKSVVQQSTLYYPGWGVTINNQMAPILYKNELGVIQVALEPGTYTYISEFRETVPRFIADMLSIVSFGVVVVLALVHNRRKA